VSQRCIGLVSPEGYERMMELKKQFYKVGILKRDSISEFVRFYVLHVLKEIEEALKERGA